MQIVKSKYKYFITLIQLDRLGKCCDIDQAKLRRNHQPCLYICRSQLSRLASTTRIYKILGMYEETKNSVVSNG